jgi:hypothetical protein
MESPDVDQVMNSDDFRETLKPEDRKLLQIFVQNLRAKRKRQKETDNKVMEEQHQISEKGKNFVN